MGRKSKGDRHLVAGRIPMPYFHKLQRVTELTGQTQSDLLAEAFVEYLDKIDLDELEGHSEQERLPLSA